MNCFLLQKIPKIVPDVLHVPNDGNVLLLMLRDCNVSGTYTTNSDGRIAINSGWKDFVLQQELEEGLDMLMTFSIVEAVMRITFVVLPLLFYRLFVVL